MLALLMVSILLLLYIKILSPYLIFLLIVSPNMLFSRPTPIRPHLKQLEGLRPSCLSCLVLALQSLQCAFIAIP